MQYRMVKAALPLTCSGHINSNGKRVTVVHLLKDWIILVVLC